MIFTRYSCKMSQKAVFKKKRAKATVAFANTKWPPHEGATNLIVARMGLKPQLFGSVMPMQAWAQHSPSELSSTSRLRLSAQDDTAN